MFLTLRQLNDNFKYVKFIKEAIKYCKGDTDKISKTFNSTTRASRRYTTII